MHDLAYGFSAHSAFKMDKSHHRAPRIRPTRSPRVLARRCAFSPPDLPNRPIACPPTTLAYASSSAAEGTPL
ncbi:uncharacterized protein CC84DRAFT_1163742, partial [Paraphaeosphaeria sporulosa]